MMTVMGEALMDRLSDAGSIPARSILPGDDKAQARVVHSGRCFVALKQVFAPKQVVSGRRRMMGEEDPMNRYKILVVDDEDRMRKLVKDFLERENYHVLECKDGVEAMDMFYREKDISLVILDIMMPGMDGWEVLREIRENSDIPVIMLTARGEERDELQGFRLGVDEYISKPFSPRILVARVGAILRRTHTEGEEDTISAGGIVVDKLAHKVSVEGREVELSVKEFELLCFFLENQNVALSRDRILNKVWDYDYYGDARTIDTHVKKLRSKLEERGHCIKTIWGMGYKFEVGK